MAGETGGTGTDGGFTLLDGVALITGASVALVHLRDRDEMARLGPGSVLFWGTFAWVALTATGPFLFLVRRFGRPAPGYPRVGDCLWAMLGLPWLATALLRSASTGADAHKGMLYSSGLGAGLAVSSIVAMAVVWATWVMVPPEQAARTAAAPWTNRLGLLLAIAWPLQCGVGLVVIG